MRVCVLSSGSGGNCLYVEAGTTRVLVDAGLALKETARRCLQVGLHLREMTAVVLTHEHADHSLAAGILARKLNLEVHATAGTLRALRDPPPAALQRTLRCGEPVSIGSLRVTPVEIPHDAAEPAAYVFEDPEGRRAAIVTDLGCAPQRLARALQGLDALVLEMNHDVRMLLEGPYPFSLKRRIRGDHGHLSNAQGAKLLADVHHPGLQHVVLAHLSEHNNTERHALSEAGAVLARKGGDVRLAVASQARAMAPIDLSRSPRYKPRQLALFG